ncbi:MAG: AgmX/PglI C-terminal domain-containing protein [Bdellovibrionaceae bacterium]|nr:AgmX/PglI C-terminal domain-containing protein [Pseudobdellovibrionaceae bacterium]
MKSFIVIRVFKSGQLVEVKQFDTDQIVIGKSDEAQLTINDSSVSPLHAVIENRGGTYFISDLGSDKGTYVGEEKILEREITSGLEILIGDFNIQFNVGVPKPMGAQPVVKVGPTVQPEPTKIKSEEPEISITKEQVQETPEIEKTINVSQTFVEGQLPKENLLKKKHVKSEGTYAPESAFTDIKQIVKPEKGTNIEVVVAWGERVISSHHFSKAGKVEIGTDPSCDVILPLVGTPLRKHKLLKIDSMAHVLITKEMTGEYVTGSNTSKTFQEMARNNMMEVKGNNFVINLAQGDMVIIKLPVGNLNIIVRYTSETPKPAMAPFFDLTASEVAGVILSIVVAAIFSLYMMVYAPEPLKDLDNKAEEPFRKAVIAFSPPKPKQLVKIAEETKKEEEKKIVKVEDLNKKAAPTPKVEGSSGKAGSVQKTPEKIKTPPKKLVSQKKQGGAVKTGAEGASAKSDKPDPKNMGILSVFGNRGTQEKLNKVFSGAGELTGIAGQATGKSGFKDDRAGGNLGARTKVAPGSGQGKESVGATGPITGGRGAGNFGFGSGSVGKKGSVQINIGGQEEAFVGTIDREAIRRVILDNISQIRNCYERILNRNPDLFGKLVIEWDIEEKGRVKSAKAISNTTGSSELASCVVGRLKNWRFPEPPEDQIARVTYPFVFAAK